jgi:hypothetical protein
MPAAIHKKPNGTWYVYSATGNTKHEREYPGCQSKSDAHEAIRRDAGLPSNARVGLALSSKTWTGCGWIDDD